MNWPAWCLMGLVMSAMVWAEHTFCARHQSATWSFMGFVGVAVNAYALGWYLWHEVTR